MKVLYVEDEVYMAKAVAQVLRKNNYSVDLAHDGEIGLALALSGVYDIVILDIMLPRRDGLSMLKEMRQQVATPVILLTAKGALEDKVTGLDSGADDYLSKPFQTEELMARLRALGRRKELVAVSDTLTFGNVALNYNALELIGRGQIFHLTLKESQLLELLIANRERTVSTDIIIEKLWGWDSDAEDSHVQVQVAFLRKKLALISDTVRIRTLRGVGYMLTKDDGEAGAGV